MVPGGGPSLDDEGWIISRHPTQRRRRKPFLVDNEELGRTYQTHFINGLRRLVQTEKLRLEQEWSKLKDPAKLEAWLDRITATDWNVFIEGPPNGESKPTDVLKYLARYMTGGPISDRRLIADEDGDVILWARGKEKSGGSKPEPFRLRGTDFVRRWAMHILPKGYTRSRSYGGYHGTKRQDYLQRCRGLLGITPDDDDAGDLTEMPERTLPTCTRCEVPMICIEQKPRPSWREVFERDIYTHAQLYSPQHHIQFGLPAAYPIDEYG